MRYSGLMLHLARGTPLVALILVACRTHATPEPLPTQGIDSVSVGYGSQARRDITGSIATVDGDVARRNSPTTLADMLDGRFAGVEVRRLAGGRVSVRIRGQRSITSGSEPLYVIDGIPQRLGGTSTLADLDPRDIKSIEVLKDASATAVYGSRGANGVILISTRRPE
jgi:TonB-dependent SusC/RagA subfamily outer membrane receptor